VTGYRLSQAGPGLWTLDFGVFAWAQAKFGLAHLLEVREGLCHAAPK